MLTNQGKDLKNLLAVSIQKMQADNNQLRQNKKRLIELLNQKKERERERERESKTKKNRLAEKERKLKEKEKEIKKKEKDSQNQIKIITNKGKKRGRKPKLHKEKNFITRSNKNI